MVFLVRPQMQTRVSELALFISMCAELLNDLVAVSSVYLSSVLVKRLLLLLASGLVVIFYLKCHNPYHSSSCKIT